MNNMLTQLEESVLLELDRLIEWYQQHKPELKSLTITKKQHSALKRIQEKKLAGKLYRRIGQLEIQDGYYRDMKLIVAERRKSRRKKDIEEMFND